MINRLHVTIFGVPVPKPRQTQRDKFKPSEAVQRYRAWADQLKWSVAGVCKQPLMGGIQLAAVFYLPIPKSYPKDWQRAAAAGEWLHVTKPDLKNLIASLEDALNGIAWADDSQICQYGTCMKRYDDGQGPRVEVLAFSVGQNTAYPQGEHLRYGCTRDKLS